MKKLSTLLLGIFLSCSNANLSADDMPLSKATIPAQNINSQDIINTVQTATTIISALNNNVNPAVISSTIANVTDVINQTNDIIDQILPADTNVGSDQQVVNTISQDELAKWKYINQYFIINLSPKTTTQKIGKLISENASFLSMPTILFYVTLGEKIITRLSKKFSKATSAKNHAPTKDASATTTSDSASSSINLSSISTGSAKYIAIPVIGGLISYKLIKYISSMIAQQTKIRNEALINFLKDWDLHKTNTPDVLWPFFEHLNQELTINNGKLPKVDALLAQKIVEAILATSTIFASLQQ